MGATADVARAQKAIVVGVRGIDQRTPTALVRSFGWADLGNLPNLRDYDTVMLVVSREPSRPFLVGPDLERHLNPGVFLDILRSGGKIIVVGDPRFDTKVLANGEWQRHQPFLSWTGLWFSWHEAAGDTVELVPGKRSAPYASYLKRVTRWAFALENCSVAHPLSSLLPLYIPVPGSKGTGGDVEKAPLKVKILPLCTNRSEVPIAFTATVGYYRETPAAGFERQPLRHPIQEIGDLVFLPPADVSDEEAVQVLLRDACGVETALPAPEWVRDMRAPGQAPVDSEIEALGTKIKELEQALPAKQAEREQVRAPLRLLFDLGASLEVAVRGVLRELGAKVEEPVDPSKEDGWITVELGEELLEGVLEIKGSRSDTLTEQGPRQLYEWKHRGIELRGKTYKGIFIGNSAVTKPPGARRWPFSDSWEKSTRLQQAVAIRAEDLYSIYEAHHAGKLDVEAFWRSVFTTNGIFDARPFVAVPAGSGPGDPGT